MELIICIPGPAFSRSCIFQFCIFVPETWHHWCRNSRSFRSWIFRSRIFSTPFERPSLILNDVKPWNMSGVSMQWNCRPICLQQAANSNATDRQLAVGWASCDDNFVQAAEASIHCGTAYLLGTQRHSSETPRSSPAVQLRPIGSSPRRRSLAQVLLSTVNNSW